MAGEGRCGGVARVLVLLLLLFCGGDDCYAYYDVLVAAHTRNTLRVSYGQWAGPCVVSLAPRLEGLEAQGAVS